MTHSRVSTGYVHMCSTLCTFFLTYKLSVFSVTSRVTEIRFLTRVCRKYKNKFSPKKKNERNRWLSCSGCFSRMGNSCLSKLYGHVYLRLFLLFALLKLLVRDMLHLTDTFKHVHVWERKKKESKSKETFDFGL